MSERRRLLLAIANQFKWLPYSYENLYYGLVPTTIDNKNVKNKARVEKVYGNSVVENQLSPYGDFNDISKWSGIRSSLSTTNNTLKSLCNNNSATSFGFTCLNAVPLLSTHFYLFVFDFYHNIDLTKASQFDITINYARVFTAQKNTWTRIYLLIKPSANYNFGNQIVARYNNISDMQVGTDYIEVKNMRVIDLTQYNPFVSSWSLLDTRVQALLNRDYIPYNTGEIKGTDIGEISSESYNLFDDVLESGSYAFANGNPVADNTKIRNKNIIKVVGGETYLLEYEDNVNYALFEYDKNGDFIKTSTALAKGQTYTLSYNACYLNFFIYSNNLQQNVCLHETGTRTGYAPYQSFSPISFKYQGAGVGTSHDKLERTDTEWVFTKNNTNKIYNGISGSGATSIYRILGSYTQFYLDNLNGIIDIGGHDATYHKTLCNIPIQNTNTEATGIVIYSQGVTKWVVLTLPTATASTVEQANTWLSNNNVEDLYPLATPQVIRIPRKHLGVVDLGTLSWGYRSDYQKFYVSGLLTSLPMNTTKIYCSEYLTAQPQLASTSQDNMTIASRTNIAGYLFVKDSRYTNATDFKNAMSGQYLFFETENEVPDILDTFLIESGGTITTDSEVLPNVDFKMKCK